MRDNFRVGSDKSIPALSELIHPTEAEKLEDDFNSPCAVNGNPRDQAAAAGKGTEQDSVIVTDQLKTCGWVIPTVGCPQLLSPLPPTQGSLIK